MPPILAQLDNVPQPLALTFALIFAALTAGLHFLTLVNAWNDRRTGRRQEESEKRQLEILKLRYEIELLKEKCAHPLPIEGTPMSKPRHSLESGYGHLLWRLTLWVARGSRHRAAQAYRISPYLNSLVFSTFTSFLIFLGHRTLGINPYILSIPGIGFIVWWSFKLRTVREALFIRILQFQWKRP